MTNDKPADSKNPDILQIACQAKVELEILLGIEQTLRTALQWMMRGRGNSHKLSTLRHHTWSFERQLTRLQLLSDHGGYLHLITDANPRLANRVESLKKERIELHHRLEKLILRLELTSHDEVDEFALICDDLEYLLNDICAHGQSECDLLQRSFTQEVGGSG